MAKTYFDKLTRLLEAVEIEADVAAPMEIKHFFSGAALYAGGVMCASWSPVGLAFKLPAAEVADLIQSGRAQPLRYFPKGHIKKGYALFTEPDLTDSALWQSLFLKAIRANLA